MTASLTRSEVGRVRSDPATRHLAAALVAHEVDPQLAAIDDALSRLDVAMETLQKLQKAEA